MKIVTSFVALLALGTGSLAGLAAYEVGAGPVTATTPVAVARDRPAAPVVRGAHFRWAPCDPPAVLREGTCVTEVVRTVTLPAPSPASTPAPAPTSPAADDDSGDDDDSRYDDDGDDDSRYDDSRYDDHGYDDHGYDDDGDDDHGDD